MIVSKAINLSKNEAVPLPEFHSEPTWTIRGRIPCLDGLRAAAIIFVLLSHLGSQIQAQTGRPVPLPDGHLGVTFFFVISGFLITLLMLREFRSTSTLSLKDFYLRRTLRIFPAFFFYLIVMFLCQKMGLIAFPWQRWVAAASYTMCLMPHLNSAWEIGHLWSLSVEEHFYLIWPLVLYFAKPVRALRILLIYLAILPALRYAIWMYGRQYFDIDFCSPTQMGSIAEGCLAAFWVTGVGVGARAAKLLEFLQRFSTVAIIGSIILLVASIEMRHVSGKYAILFSDPANATFFMMLMVSILYLEKGFIARALSARPVVWIGILSYSVYLWQQPLTAKGFWANRPSFWLLNVAIIGLVACFSYYFVEAPFLRLKDARKKKGQSENTAGHHAENKQDIPVSTRPLPQK